MADESKMSLSKKLNALKLFLSSLYARKQKFLVVDGNEKGLFYLTNVPYERIPLYRPDIEDTMAKVRVKGLIADLLYEALPVFGQACFELTLAEFTAAFNKILVANRSEYPKMSVNQKDNTMVMAVPQLHNPKGNVEVGDATPEEFETLEGSPLPPIDTVVGRVISSHAFEYYENVFKYFMGFAEQHIEREVTVPQAYSNDKVVLSSVELANPVKNRTDVFKVPLQDGTNIPSFKEYLSKRKLPWIYKLLIGYRPEQSVAKIAVSFSDDWVDTLTIMPALLWFPFKDA